MMRVFAGKEGGAVCWGLDERGAAEDGPGGDGAGGEARCKGRVFLRSMSPVPGTRAELHRALRHAGVRYVAIGAGPCAHEQAQLCSRTMQGARVPACPVCAPAVLLCCACGDVCGQGG